MKEINMSDKNDSVEPKNTEETSKTGAMKKKVENNKESKSDNKSVKEKSKKEKKPKKEKVEKENLKPGKSVSKKKGVIVLAVLGLLFLLAIAAFYYFGIYKYNPQAKKEDIVEINSNYITAKLKTETLAHILVDEPQEPRTEESPLNGLLFTKSEMDEMMQKRPVAVMINNHAVSRPQSGVSSADIVYETLAESGITRYMAFFWSEGPTKVGSIRSARQYFLEWLSPYDPLYIHIGWADTDDPRTDARGNIYAYNIKDVGIRGYWVWNDGRRVAPHNKYNSVVSAWDYAETQGWDGFPEDFESWKFKNDAVNDLRGDAYRYSIKFHNRLTNSGLYDTIWEYDKVTNSYKRWVGGEPNIDQETNTQLTAKVVVVQEIVMTPSYDEKGRIIQETIGEGDAIILMDGKEVYGTWKKNNRMDRTTFYGEDGNEIEFNRGRIWISAIAQSVGEFDIIEQ
jgi:hypothetical protein